MTASLDPALFHGSAAPFVSALNRFLAREGHATPRHDHVEDGLGLGAWAAQRRVDYRAGRLRPERATALEALPGWQWTSSRYSQQLMDTYWDDGIRALDAFVGREGHATVPRNHREGAHHLGAWVMNRRVEHRKGALAPARASLLESYPGWSWGRGKDKQWAEGLAALVSYVEREGHSLVPVDHVEDGHSLGSWVQSTRRAFRQGRLLSSRAALLEQFPCWQWDVAAARWEQWLEALHAYAKRVGDARVPQDHVEGCLLLGEWVLNRRRKYRLGLLSAEEAAALESVTGWAWSVRPPVRRQAA